MSQSNVNKDASQASNASASASATGGADGRYIELTDAEAAKVDMNAVKWEDTVEHHTKNVLRNQRRVEYDVPDVGVVAEEWQIQLVTLDGKTTEEAALHSVFVGGRLVRQVDMKTGQVVVSEAAYAPFDFLRYDAYGSTERGGAGGGEGQVPVIESKQNGGGQR